MNSYDMTPECVREAQQLIEQGDPVPLDLYCQCLEQGHSIPDLEDQQQEDMIDVADGAAL